MQEDARWERWVTAPRQARARATFERVLDTGAALLVESGYEGFSMSEVCRRADVAVGTLYNRVEGKDTLFLALHDRELERLTGDCVALLAEVDRVEHEPGELVDAVFGALCRHYREEHRLLSVFILRSAVDPRVREAAAYHVVRLEAAVISSLMRGRRDYPHPDPQAAVRVATGVVLDSLSYRTAFGAELHGPDVAPDDDRWTASLIDVARTYLLTPPLDQRRRM